MRMVNKITGSAICTSDKIDSKLKNGYETKMYII